MAGERRFLQWHRNQWRVELKVPVAAQAAMGCKVLKQGLGTASLAEANRLKWDVIAGMRQKIEAATKLAASKGALSGDPLVAEAMKWREAIRQEEAAPDFDPEARATTLELAGDRTEEIEEREGDARARTFNAIATGKETPIAALVEAWLQEQKVSPRSNADYERAVERFTAWCSASKLPPVIEKVTRRVAGRFVSEVFIAKGSDPKTTNKYVSAMSSYWRWLVKRGHCEENPWSGQSVAKAKLERMGKDYDKRPFSDAEIVALLTNTVFDQKKAAKVNPRRSAVWNALPDVMRIAALSGMRIEEIARLETADCKGEVFNIRRAKTQAGIRRVPIHPDLKALVARRCERREDGAFLIHELKTPDEGSKLERSMPLVKAFGVYRKGLGVDEQPNGARQSRVDFHSFRRWFITKAEIAGQPPHIISAVVGHEVGRQGMTLGVYSGGPSLEQMKACVDAVCSLF